jgi:hypothetical protein
MLFEEEDDDEDEQELSTEGNDELILLLLELEDEEDEELLLLELSDDELLLELSEDDDELQLQLSESTNEEHSRSSSIEADSKLNEMLLLSQLLSPSRLQALFPRSSIMASEGCLNSSGLASWPLMLADAHTANRRDRVRKRVILAVKKLNG